ncbi:MAG: hypothetical protein GC190_14925 [Alphaproteobacteria bacterium]|nr:hypothetical protein [Alphaproteobacteria bacterium]
MSVTLRHRLRSRPVLSALAVVIAVAVDAHADDGVGLWIKNTSPVPVTVSVDGAEACQLEAPIYRDCSTTIEKRTAKKITKLTEKKRCSTNNLKISCITNIPAAGADVSLRRSDGIEYKVRAAKGGTLYLCVEPKRLTNCFGTKLQ